MTAPYPPPPGVEVDADGGWTAHHDRETLPVHTDDTGPTCCKATKYYTCTRDLNHDGWHIATIARSRVIAVWPKGQLPPLEPTRCMCPHGDDWHGPGGCEARGCGCEVVPS